MQTNNMTFDEETKKYWVEVMQEHQDKDRLVQGVFLLDDDDGEKDEQGFFRGCFFGCAMQLDDEVAIDEAAREMNLPLWLVKIAERIFENLPAEDALEFPVKFLKAIPPNTDLTELRKKIYEGRLTKLEVEFLEYKSFFDFFKRTLKGWEENRRLKSFSEDVQRKINEVEKIDNQEIKDFFEEYITQLLYDVHFNFDILSMHSAALAWVSVNENRTTSDYYEIECDFIIESMRSLCSD